MQFADSLNLCENMKSDKGAASDKRLRIVINILRQVFITMVTMLAHFLTKSMPDYGYAPLLAALAARTFVFTPSKSGTGIKSTIGGGKLASSAASTAKASTKVAAEP